MHEITDIEKLVKLKASGAVFILFGGKQCNVCHALRPQLENMLESHYPDITSAYIDCEVSPDICAQHSVFTLPVVQFYIEGMKIDNLSIDATVNHTTHKIEFYRAEHVRIQYKGDRSEWRLLKLKIPLSQ